jgi:hypothetical protein
MKIVVAVAALAFALGFPSLARAATTLHLAGYHGSGLPGAVPGADRFALTVNGAPNAHVRLTALAVPTGYLASFCTALVCAPFAVRITLPPSGAATIELQIIRNDPHAVRPRIVAVASNDGARASIAYAAGTR